MFGFALPLMLAVSPPAADLGNWDKLYKNAERYAQVVMSLKVCEAFGYKADDAAALEYGQTLKQSFGEQSHLADEVITGVLRRKLTEDLTEKNIAVMNPPGSAEMTKFKVMWALRCGEVASDPVYGKLFSGGPASAGK